MPRLGISLLLIAAQAACGVTEQPSPPGPSGSEARGAAELTLQPGTLGFMPDSAGRTTYVRGPPTLGGHPRLRKYPVLIK